MKVVTVVGTRPELIRLSSVIACLDRHHEHTLIHTGQNYDYQLNEVFFHDLGIREPNYFLNCNKSDPASAVGDIITGTYKVLENTNPDAFLVLGDTNSCLSAYAAKRLKVPVFHMEAGNRCFDQRVPEEINRKVVDSLADVNMPYSQISREYLLREGFDPRFIVVTGSPMREVILNAEHGILNSDILNKLDVDPGNYLVASIHREENVEYEHNLKSIIKGLESYAHDKRIRVLFSTHPRTKKILSGMGVEDGRGIEYLEPLGFFDYIKLQQNAACVISDSGTIFEEAAILNVPAISVRNTYERPEAFEVSSAILAEPKESSIVSNIDLAIDMSSGLEIPSDYSVTNVAEKVVKIISSYTAMVNNYKWHKDG